MKIFVGCASSEEIPAQYLEDSKKYLSVLLKDNDLIFGAYNKGIMGLSYDIAKENKRKIIGICPEVYQKDLEDLDLDIKGVTASISERTMELINKSDAIIFMPGGIGTMQELFTAIESKRSKEFDKPIIIYNSNGYFDETLKMLEKIYDEKFTSKIVKECYHVSNSIEDTLEYLNKEKRNWKIPLL